MTGAEVRTACPYCGVGCGVLARAGDGGAAVRGDPEHPANRGRLCSKGAALGETTGLDGRLLYPEVRGRRASWDEALGLVAGRFAEAVAAHGPDSVAFYVSGQLLTEDYYAANKLMKGFIGSANIDTNSRLCMASSVAGHKRAFGEDLVPGTYEDLEAADLVVLVGSNLAWCHPVLHQRLLAARAARGTRIVVIDPRRSATADDADLHLALRPGTDVLLFNGLLAHLARAGLTDDARVAGLPEALALARADAPDAARVARGCDVPQAAVAAFFDLFAATERSVTVYSQGVNQSAHGTDKVNAIINCHLATSRIGREGTGPFSVTGQPNAMGGREVGGLANQLAAHMAFEPADVDRVARFWGAPGTARAPGLKAVEMFEAVRDGRIKALWVMGTNPAVSMPDAGRVREALARVPFLAVSDVARTDTTRHAHALLPALAWGEKDGTVTNSERRITRQRAFLPPPGEARADWAIVADVARRMGFQGFAWPSRAAVFREHAALTAWENDGARVLDLGALADLSDEAYEDLSPVQWPARRGEAAGGRLLDSRFPTPDGRACAVPVRQEGLALAVGADRPLLLNTGRSRDQWHTMTRTGAVPRLMTHAPEPVLDLAPADAHGVEDGDLVEVSSAFGTALARARVTDAQRAGEAFLPMHWSGRYAARAGAGAVSNPATDPHSGQPELKAVPVRVARLALRWQGLLLTARDLRPTGLLHWSRAPVPGGWAYELMGAEPPAEGVMLARALLAPASLAGLIDYADARAGTWRAAALDGAGRLAEALLVAPPRRLPDRAWLLSLLASGAVLGLAERRALLSGRAPTAQLDRGRIVCACLGIGLNDIRAAAGAGALDVAAVGLATGAGTNCGSCRSEIRGILDATRLHAAE